MRSASLIHRALPAVFLLLLTPYTLDAQTGQSTTGTTGTGTTGTTGTGTSTTTTTTRSRTRGTTTTNPDSQPQMPRRLNLFITGTVVMEDGNPPPFGVVIERVCYGRVQKEAYADSKGGFGFMLGANSNVIFDASDSSIPSRDGVPGLSPDGLGTSGPSAILNTGDCDVRAQLAGHRSSTIPLRINQVMGNVDVGTIVLYPAVKVRGTMTSLTSLSAPKNARKAFERGEKALEHSNYEEAEKNLSAAVAAYSKYAAAWFSLGQTYQRLQRTAEARDAYGKALEADGNFVGPYIGLAHVAAVEQKWQEAADLSERGLTLDPLDYPEGFYFNAVANYNLDKLENAERSARKAQRLDPLHHVPGAHLILAYILERKKDLAGELEQLRLYLKYAPEGTNTARARTRLDELEKTMGQADPMAKK